MEKKNVYAVFGNEDTATIDEAVARVYPEDNYYIAPGQWLIRDLSVLPEEIHKKLSKHDDKLICIINRMTGFYGWQDKGIWDWIEATNSD